jgi:hypothetical protein
MMLKISRWNWGKTASTSGRELGVNSANLATRWSISSLVTAFDVIVLSFLVSDTGANAAGGAKSSTRARALTTARPPRIDAR